MSRQGSYRARFHDPDGARHGIPTYNRHSAPAGLATRRQLRELGLSPNGQDPVAQVMWVQWRRDAVAYLYDVNKCTRKRVPTPAQLDAVRKALDARRTCRICQQVRDYCMPKVGPLAGRCVDCHPDLPRTSEPDTPMSHHSAA